MNVNFMDACHLRARGKDVYDENIKQLKRVYVFIKSISRYSKAYPAMVDAALLGISDMLTLKRMGAAIKLCSNWDDYKRVFVNQLEQEA